MIDAAQDAADRLNKRNAGREGWIPLTWRDIAQPPMPEGINVNIGQTELGGKPDESNAEGAPIRSNV